MGNSHTHVINHQDGTNINDTIVNTANQSEESDGEVGRYVPSIDLDEKVLQRLKQRDPTITHLRVDFSCDDDEYIFNSIDWEKDGHCISDNTHLKKLTISYRPYNQHYTLGEQGDNFPTKQQLRDFFSCIYRSSSIEELTIHRVQFVDEFGGSLIEGLGGHPSISELYMSRVKLGSIGYTALWYALQHPKSKVKHLYLMNCQLDGDGIKVYLLQY